MSKYKFKTIQSVLFPSSAEEVFENRVNEWLQQEDINEIVDVKYVEFGKRLVAIFIYY